MRSLPTRLSSRRAASSKASGEGRLSDRVVLQPFASILSGYRRKSTAPALGRRRAHRSLGRAELIEREVELEHVDARFAEDAKQAALGVIADQLAQLVLGQVARLGDARQLELAPPPA